MVITAKVICDSIAHNGVRLTTLELEYPRWILAELNTHRMFSRSTASSRAIPIEKVIEQVQTRPAMPVHWGKNQRGMQAMEELSGPELDAAKKGWLEARDAAVAQVQKLAQIGLHKQVSNRILEPWVLARTVVTATDWDNFFALRLHPDAQPEMQALARGMRNVMELTTPRLIDNIEWHLPYLTSEEYDSVMWGEGDPLPGFMSYKKAVKLSAARCARVSYNRHGAGTDHKADIELHDRLVSSGHMSPLEHQARPLNSTDYSGNLKGWRQYRKTVANEAVYKIT